MGRRVLQSKLSVLRLVASAGILSVGLLVGAAPAAFAQSGNDHPQDQKPQASNPADIKENQRKADEFTEAAQALSGGPAGNPECVWLGRRVVQLMYRDDLDTAFRHLDLYDRFGCPGGHIQASFRCLTRFVAQIDDKVPNSLNNHVHACWVNPDTKPQVATAPAPAATPVPAGSQPAPQPAAPQAAPSPQPAKQ
ncbi:MULTISPECIES: beta-1-3, beta-1-6-glucan biosynthesis protein [unclassified Bradyrhizobium]|uniref:beta-1-3, beta-1-6-glucan biosynthesis protein n=1 Tax=unclassified Bradyrhizobium TaxID=2631580 RepID=UPI0024E05676|nr:MULTISPECIES: beta-1-3, beta-1-6-glucan biosynthesis protein [unclassified Bradyrhizobium]